MRKGYVKVFLITLAMLMFVTMTGTTTVFGLTLEPKEVFKGDIVSAEVNGYLAGFNMRSEDITYTVKSAEPLYTLNRDPAYVLVKFLPEGFAIIERNNAQFLEYAFEGDGPYSDTTVTKYYFGPFEYYEETNKEQLYSIYSKSTVTKESLAHLDQGMKDIRKTITQDKMRPSTMSYVEGGATYIDRKSTLDNMIYFGANWYGTCGQVAMGVLLQFYTSFNCRIIPYQFDYSRIISYIEPTSNDDPIVIIRQEIAESLHQEVITLTPYIPFFDPAKPTTHLEQYTGFQNYISKHIPNKGVRVEKTAPLENVDSYVKSRINSNTPSILTLTSYTDQDGDHGEFLNGDAHCVVAYGYRQINGSNEYYVHTGWNRGLSYKPQWFSDYFAWGACSLIVPANIPHNGPFSYKPKDGFNHTVTCDCNLYTTQSKHIFTYDFTLKMNVCSICGYKTIGLPVIDSVPKHSH